MDGPKQSDQTEPSLNVLQRFERHVQGKTLAGLIELLPLLVTFLVLAFIIGYADDFIRPLAFVKDRPWDFPGVGLIAALVVFYFVGLLISTRPGRLLMDWKDVVLSRIPVVKTVFGVTQQATVSLTSPYNFSRVVFLEWPTEGMVAMGFVTGTVYSHHRSESMVVVYIPTVPNPTSGNMAFILEDDVMETDLTVKDAMKLVFSGGIVLPETLTMARAPKAQRDSLSLVGQFKTEPPS